MEVKAINRSLKIAPRKVRLVIGVVRGLSVEAAIRQLGFVNKASAEPVKKLILSAVSNAKGKGLDEKTLQVKSILANPGPVLYRYRPRAMGRAFTIRKKTTHVTVVLEGTEKVEKSKLVENQKIEEKVIEGNKRIKASKKKVAVT